MRSFSGPRPARPAGSPPEGSRTMVNLVQRLMRIALLMLSLAPLAGCERTPPAHPAAPVSDGDVRVEIAALPMDEPVFMSYEYARDRRVNFFVIRSEAGVHAYFDACLTCYARKRGYRFSGGTLYCNACGERYGLDQLDQGLTGCRPIPLPGRAEGGAFLIDRTDLMRESAKFY